ncbi:hypothetical protein [Cohnella algarum]|uniref:hypothetical protein n=1 Tax=Cohnella algarum TaxID=2044859 RepID=UPI001966E130|nr:hypothetical protein [Cohnella algarum]MBN2981818.1 hypothetical protein [Cohnella algarum]
MLEQLLRFRECEHQGDLDAYARDVSRCGGIIIARELDAAAEKVYLTVTFSSISDREAFWEKFKQTDSAPFCS